MLTLLLAFAVCSSIWSIIFLAHLWADAETQQNRQRVARLTLASPLLVPLSLPILTTIGLYWLAVGISYCWRTAFPRRATYIDVARGPYR